MKQHPLRLLLIPALLCALFGVAYLGGTGTAHAASAQPHVAAPLVARVNCTGDGKQVSIGTDYDAQNDCFSGKGSASVVLYNVMDLNSGSYTFSFNWTGCDGSTHSSKVGPNTYLYSGKAPNGFAGCTYMSKITYISLS
jgi:uncharacterized membrane protein